ncbi:hypothetical protein EX30DRAFT_35671 [Ascodesmis nigricans]|uniref:Uncharacterized protein n=1 Tax=Ascodesmis nigricans TaxID=341454 RepID=A0A4S2MWP4_9PEZI|nr:hypothetical protein EX30DRAFT_35671 [Ascodesmis nigricans]
MDLSRSIATEASNHSTTPHLSGLSLPYSWITLQFGMILHLEFEADDSHNLPPAYGVATVSGALFAAAVSDFRVIWRLKVECLMRWEVDQRGSEGIGGKSGRRYSPPQYPQRSFFDRSAGEALLKGILNEP